MDRGGSRSPRRLGIWDLAGRRHRACSGTCLEGSCRPTRAWRIRARPPRRFLQGCVTTWGSVKARRLLGCLESSLENNRKGDQKEPPSVAPSGPRYAQTVALPGSLHPDYRDVASDKYKHLAEIYADKQAPIFGPRSGPITSPTKWRGRGEAAGAGGGWAGPEVPAGLSGRRAQRGG